MRKLWINKQHLDGSGGVREVIDPATEEIIGEVAWGTRKEAELAVQAAKAAFPAWRKIAAPTRTAMLHEVARRLRENLESIAIELTLETGRTLYKNRGYVEWSAQCFDYYAELSRDQRGRVIPSPEDRQLSLVLKVPLGVVAAIVPWNYPLLLLAWKLAPALAAGNTVVVKPASYTPWTTLGLDKIFDHLPPGVVNFVSGSGSEVGDYLVTHPDVRMIAFTGSTEVGQHIMRQAAQDIKRIHLELGGKDPLIVCADAEIHAAARAAVWGGFLNAGQVCTSVERVYVEHEIFTPFLERVVELSRNLVIGPGMDPETEITPMIRPSERQAVDEQVQAAIRQGAILHTGGRIPPDKPKGYFYEPTVLSQVNEDMEVMCRETFGPVLPVVAVDSLEEALQRANRSEYGLGATLFTQDAKKVLRYIEEIEAGNVWINDPLIDNVAGPFGGMKRSGLGRELGHEGLEDFQETKYIHWEVLGREKPWWYPLE